MYRWANIGYFPEQFDILLHSVSLEIWNGESGSYTKAKSFRLLCIVWRNSRQSGLIWWTSEGKKIRYCIQAVLLGTELRPIPVRSITYRLIYWRVQVQSYIFSWITQILFRTKERHSSRIYSTPENSGGSPFLCRIIYGLQFSIGERYDYLIVAIRRVFWYSKWIVSLMRTKNSNNTSGSLLKHCFVSALYRSRVPCVSIICFQSRFFEYPILEREMAFNSFFIEFLVLDRSRWSWNYIKQGHLLIWKAIVSVRLLVWYSLSLIGAFGVRMRLHFIVIFFSTIDYDFIFFAPLCMHIILGQVFKKSISYYVT